MGVSVREKDRQENEDRINGIHYNTTPYITQYCSDELFFGWGHPKEHRYVDKDCPGNYQIIKGQVWSVALPCEQVIGEQTVNDTRHSSG